MGECVSKETCEMRHTAIVERVKVLENRANNYGPRLDAVEQDGREYRVEIRNLCKQIEGLIATLKWTIGIVVTATGVIIAIVK